jgi:glycosyltransferase involved in cell wall biosynthesis
MLEACLDAVQALDYPDFDVLVVDNAPTTDETARLVRATPARYCREERPGLDWARNRGIAEATGEIMAFIDDDARPDPRWLSTVAAAFTEPEVMAVTGMVAPAELETRAQIVFELSLGGMTQSTRRRVIRRQELTSSQLLWSSSYGVGTNMAFRRSVFDVERTFDPALDVGTPTRGGGDLEMFQRLVSLGYTLVYEPAALVWHVHRRTESELTRQVHSNGRGFGSYLWTCLRNRTARPGALLTFALRQWLWGWILRRLVRPGEIPRRLVLAELAGALLSPLAFLLSRAGARRASAHGKEGGAPQGGD